MELREFVETALTDIAQAVVGANKTLGAKGTEKSYRMMKGYEGYLKDLQTKNPGFIDFDVAVSAKNENNKEGKAGIHIKVVEIGGLFGSKTSSERISRIKFSVGLAKEIS